MNINDMPNGFINQKVGMKNRLILVYKVLVFLQIRNQNKKKTDIIDATPKVADYQSSKFV